MTGPALLKKADLNRMAEVATRKGVRFEVKIGDAVITVIPEDNRQKDAGIDYSRPSW